MATAKKTAPKPTNTAKPAAPKVETATSTTQPVEAAVNTGQETVDTVVKTSTEVAKKGVEKAVVMGQEQMAAAVKANSDAYKGYEDMIDFSKSNIDAFVKSNEIFTKGMQDFNSTVYALAQANVEESVKLTQKLMGCGSVAEAFELQTEVAKTQYSKSVDESRKLSQMSIKLAENASKPIAERINVAVEKFSKPIAA